MKINRFILSIVIALGALLHQSDGGQQSRTLSQQLRLAGVMPRGAMLYVQARDFSAVMKRWMSSPVRAQFYASPSFDSFSKSRIYIKLQDRKTDFETALGFGIDEARLVELAGGASAISIYDIGKLEMVFVTEISRPRAIATALFKQASQFQERPANGTPYYVHDVTTDGGRLNQQFCFAYSGGKLIVTTTEGLMVRALANLAAPGADSLLSDVMATSDSAPGLATHDLTLWIDQGRLNQNRYFTNYWVHHNVSEQQPDSLAAFQSGLIDVTFGPEGIGEQRWFVLKTDQKSRAADKSLADAQAKGLLRFAPASAQLIKLHGQPGSGDQLGGVISRALFGKLPDQSSSPPANDSAESAFNSTTEEAHGRTERYSSLDMRFDVDVDDEQAPKLGGQPGSPGTVARKTKPGPAAGPEKRFANAVAGVLASAAPVGYSEMTRSSLEPGKPFARFERAIVVEMTAPAAIDRASLERAVVDELRARFVVAGAEPRLEWQDDAATETNSRPPRTAGSGSTDSRQPRTAQPGSTDSRQPRSAESGSTIRYVAQTLLDQGAAYSISGKYLILASTREFARDILEAASSPAARSTASSARAASSNSAASIAPAGSTAPPASATRAASSARAASSVFTLDGPADFYAIIRVAAAKPVFDKLMSKLDGRTEEAGKAAKKTRDDNDSESETNDSADSGDNDSANNERGGNDSDSGSTVKFFSDNLSSLIAASAIREIRLQRQIKGSLMIERVTYSW